ncbi:DUF1616 domain-containing protein [Candidatus Bathyarchaeota archaeon]|nr:DUF1616 domain-containing protein [Candidatus Bathyarchaeota archaeon]
MNLQGYKVLLLCVTAILALLVASPALQRLLVYPQTEFFTEMWLLGPEHTAENYPSNITLNENYKVFLGTSNHLGHCAYYVVQVKFRNQNQSAPDTFARTPSSLPPLHSVNFIVADKEAWELPVTFSFDYSYDENNSQVIFNQMMFNGAALNLNGYSTTWDSEKSRFFGNLIFELWIYNDAIGDFTYHERYNDLKFNMTV